MLLMCFSTAPSLTTSSAAIAAWSGLGHQAEHVQFAGGERRQRMTAAGEQLRDDLGVKRAALRRHPVQRGEELGQVGDPVLEQVPDALRPVGKQFGGVPFLHILGQHKHPDRGPRACAPPVRRAGPRR